VGRPPEREGLEGRNKLPLVNFEKVRNFRGVLGVVKSFEPNHFTVGPYNWENSRKKRPKSDGEMLRKKSLSAGARFNEQNMDKLFLLNYGAEREVPRIVKRSITRHLR